MSNDTFAYTDERFADIQMLRYRLDGFERLSVQQKRYIYYLSEATLCGRDILFDQNGRHNLLIRKTLEAVYLSYDGDRESTDFKAMEEYLKRVWFSSGIHHHYGCEKFQPAFSEEWLRAVVFHLPTELLPAGWTAWADVFGSIRQAIFDPDYQSKRVNLAEGDDLVLTSACNFYEGVDQRAVEDYYNGKKALDHSDEQPSYGLNSKLVNDGGRLREDVYTTSGLYGAALRRVVGWLMRAATVAENDQQQKVIKLLIDYYTTGNLHKFDQYSIAWLQEQEGDIDFINGFIEVYGDPLGLKGSWEGLVEYKDPVATRRTRLVSDNAQWFEDHSPVDPRFRKEKVQCVSASVISVAMLGGDSYPASPIGINLPNADWIRARYGSKSVTIGNLTDAYKKAAHGNGFDEEFVIDDATRQLLRTYGDQCDDLHTDLHECLGHGSGQILPGVDADALKAYGSTNEEARADLFGLYYMADPKLVELGLLPDGEAYKSQYYSYMMNGLLTQLVRIRPGHQIEESHMRNRALIARWTLAHGEGAVQLVQRDGKTFAQVNDYPALRTLFGRLLAEVQRIKSEGDYEAAKQLVETYGVTVDSTLHKEILERYARLGLAPYKGFINPRLTPVTDRFGAITDIEIDYTEGYAQQMLRYSRDYGTL